MNEMWTVKATVSDCALNARITTILVTSYVSGNLFCVMCQESGTHTKDRLRYTRMRIEYKKKTKTYWTKWILSGHTRQKRPLKLITTERINYKDVVKTYIYSERRSTTD